MATGASQEWDGFLLAVLSHEGDPSGIDWTEPLAGVAKAVEALWGKGPLDASLVQILLFFS